MTDVIAERAADAAGASVYVVRHPENYPHHLPSALYRAEESERLAEFLDHVEVAVSLHGYGRIGRSTQLLAGGRNRALADTPRPARRGPRLSGRHRPRRDPARAARPAPGQPGQPGARRRHPARTDAAGARHQPAQPVARRRRAVPRDIRAGPGARREPRTAGNYPRLSAHRIHRRGPSPTRFDGRAGSRPTHRGRRRLWPASSPTTTSPVASPSCVTVPTLTRSAAGYSDVDARTGFVPNTHIRAASITKTFVAATILQLVAEGRVDLDAPIETYLPGRIRGAGIDANAITVRQLLRHQSGLPEYFDADTPPPDDPTTAEQLLDMALTRPAQFTPGSEDEVHEHQLHRSRTPDREGDGTACRRRDHLAHPRAAGPLRHLLPGAAATPGCGRPSRTATSWSTAVATTSPTSTRPRPGRRAG